MENQLILQKINQLRGQKVLLDFELATLYNIETRVLKQAVRRNIDRFPEDFMFELGKEEWKELITKRDNLPENIQYSPVPPFAFTEQGVAMLSSVLKSQTAIEVNIAIMRAFVMMRQYQSNYEELARKIAQLEEEMDMQFKDINQAMNYLMEQDEDKKTLTNRKPIGFKKEEN